MGKTKDSIKLLTVGIRWCQAGKCNKCSFNNHCEMSSGTEIEPCFNISAKKALEHLSSLRDKIDVSIDMYKRFSKLEKNLEEKPMVFGGFIICQKCRKAYNSAEGHVCETKTPPWEEDKIKKAKTKKTKVKKPYERDYFDPTPLGGYRIY